MTGIPYSTRENEFGTGNFAGATVTSNTTGSNTVIVTCSAGVPSYYAVGQVVSLTGGGLDAALVAAPMRIEAVTATSLTVRCPFGLVPSVSGTGSVQPINVGGVNSVGTGNGPDGWAKTVGTQIWREEHPSNLTAGSIYSLACRKTTASQEYVVTKPDYRKMAGRQIVFGCWVNQRIKSGSGTWQLFFNTNGTGGGITTSANAVVTIGTFQWIELTVAVPKDATSVSAGLYFNGGISDVYYLANPVLTFGSVIGDGGYIKPRETLLPIVKHDLFINRSLKFPAVATGGFYYFDVDVHALSWCKIAKTVRLSEGSIEGINTGAVVVGIAAGTRLIGWADTITPPSKLSNYMGQYVSNVKSYASLRLPINGDGWAICYSGVANDLWQNVSVDLDVFLLE
jgi:hypothetical protein